ncbi:hypothetical protein ESB13_09775 [Filimonas effusa]|uniref:Uncharacterized protein n=1 Tax=Filimonas effusa TaxID=2508721 RepID=A0A4Q1DC44_9BACT|nr:hypothetical protein ESB13_09775 [Filimonas effusa]
MVAYFLKWCSPKDDQCVLQSIRAGTRRQLPMQ